MSSFLQSVQERAATLHRRIVFPEGTEERTLTAIVALQRRDLLEPVVLGPSETVRPALDALGGRGAVVEVVDPATDPRRQAFAGELVRLRAHKGMTEAAALEQLLDPLMFGAMMVRLGQVDGSVAGAGRTTADVLRAALWCVGVAPGMESVSSAFYMVVPPFRGTTAAEVLTFTDASVVPDPTVRQLADIAQAAVQARRKIVGDEPRVAFLSYSTRGSAAGPLVDKVQEAYRLFHEEVPAVPADGELQGDAALIADIASRKAPGSALGGTANVLIFPNLDAGNIAYKLVQRLAHAEAVGPILQGLARPCNDLSRGAVPEDILNVACITALQA